jgi:hypothetical protein
MHREVYGAGQQCLLDFLGEQPLSASGRSWIASPVVRIILISICSGGTPHAADSRLSTSRAWTSASGEPREPMRRMGDVGED